MFNLFGLLNALSRGATIVSPEGGKHRKGSISGTGKNFRAKARAAKKRERQARRADQRRARARR